MKLATNALAGLANTLVRRAHLFDQAVPHDGDAVGHGQGLELVVGDNHRRLGKAGKHFLDLAAHGLAQLDIKTRQRLVEEEAIRIADDGASHRDPLLLAFGDLVGQAVEHVLEMEDAGDAPDPALRSADETFS